MQWLQYLLPLLLILGPVIGHIYKWYENQQKEKAVRDERERRKREALRTGVNLDDAGGFRPDPTGPQTHSQSRPAAQPAQPSAPVSGRERLQELQAKRRAEIEARIRERRERAAQPQTSQSTSGVRLPGQPPASPGPAGPYRPPSVPSQPQYIPPPQTARPQTQPQGPSQRRSQPQPSRGPQRRSQTQRQRPIPSQRIQQQRPTIETKGVEPTTVPVTDDQIGSPRRERKKTVKTPSALALSFTRMSPEDWKKAIVMREVLGQPIGARPPGELDRGDPLA